MLLISSRKDDIINIPSGGVPFLSSYLSPLEDIEGAEVSPMARYNARRNLDTQISADKFVEQVLGILNDDGSEAAKIVGAELGLQSLEDCPTATHKDYRVAKYRSVKERQNLRNKILLELIDKKRLDNDDEIELGQGGAKPEDIQANLQAYIVSGPPASGKSKIAESLATQHGAYILDSDYAKRKFPEYRLYDAGASLVHEESDEIIFGREPNSTAGSSRYLFEYCAYSHYNMVIPMVGRTVSSVKRICDKLRDANYSIHIINVVLDPCQCAIRAFKRFCDTGRYVPLSYVFDDVGDKPEVVYFRLKRDCSGDSCIASFTQVSTDVPYKEPPKILERTAFSPL